MVRDEENTLVGETGATYVILKYNKFQTNSQSTKEEDENFDRTHFFG